MNKEDARYKCPKCGITGISKKGSIPPLCHICKYKVRMEEVKE